MTDAMMTECPNCQMEYRIKVAAIPAEGRQAKCSCGAKWMVYRPGTVSQVYEPPPAPEPDPEPIQAPAQPPPPPPPPLASHQPPVAQAPAPVAAAPEPAPAGATTAADLQKTWSVETPDGVLEGQGLYAVRDLIRSGKLTPAYRACATGGADWMEAGAIPEFQRYFKIVAHGGAGPGGAQVTTCVRHPDVTATHLCSKCGNPYCANCVVPGQGATADFMMCPECQVHCSSIEGKKEITPFWMDVPGLLAYPFRKFGTIMLLICTVLFTLGAIPPYYGAFFSLLAWAYALHALRKSADGLDHLPEFQEINDPFADLLMPGIRLFLASIVSFIPLLVYASIKGGGIFGFFSLAVDPVAWILVVVALTYYPMVVVIVAIYRSIKPAVNPAAVYQAIIGIKTDYLIMLGFLAVLFVVNIIVSIVLGFIPFSLPAEQLVRTYSMLVQFNILGRMVYQTQDRVSWYG